MKSDLILRCVILAAIVVSASVLPLGAGDEKPAQAVQKVLDDQVIAWNKKDLEGFMAGYWQSPDLSFFSGNAKTKGWQATLERYRKRYQGEGKEMGTLKFSELSIEMLGTDHALVKGRYQLTFLKESPTGLFTLVMKRFPAGWRIIHDHTSN